MWLFVSGKKSYPFVAGFLDLNISSESLYTIKYDGIDLDSMLVIGMFTL